MRFVNAPALRYWSDAALNLVGIVGPGIIAIAAIPVLLSSMTTRDFATLSLQLAVLTVVGINDIGIARSLVLVGSDGAAGRDARSYTVLLRAGVRLALYLAGIVTVLGLIVLAVVVAVTSDGSATSAGASWAILFGSIVLSLPAASLRAGLELRQRFGVVAIIRLVGNSLMYALPAAAAFHWQSLLAAALALLVSRAIFLLLVAVPQWSMIAWGSAFDAHVEAHVQRQLLRRGWWIGLTGVLSNLIAYMDRFALGIWATAAATASYSVASDLLTKQWLLTGSLLTVATPRLAATWVRGDIGHSRRNFNLLALSVLATAIACHIVISFAGWPLLKLWLGSRFTPEIHAVAAVMSLGMAVNAVALLHFLVLNVAKRDAHGALLQLASLTIFFVVTAIAAATWGAIAVAAVFAARLTIDAFVGRSLVPAHPDGAVVGLSYLQMAAWVAIAALISVAGWMYSVPG